jgi:hypothetical protein
MKKLYVVAAVAFSVCLGATGMTLFSLNAAAAPPAPPPEVDSGEQTIDIPTVCFPTDQFIKALGDYKVMTSYEFGNVASHKMTDLMIYSKTVDSIFVVRSNSATKYTCIMTMFENIKNPPPKTEKPVKPLKQV